MWRNVWADISTRSTRIWALGFITRSLPSESIVMWENNLLNSSLLCSISWGRSGKYYGINLCNLVFLASFRPRFLGKVKSVVCFYAAFVIFPFICFVSAAAVGCCIVSRGNLALSLVRAMPWSVLLAMTCCELNQRTEHLQRKRTLPHNFLNKSVLSSGLLHNEKLLGCSGVWCSLSSQCLRSAWLLHVSDAL